MDISDILRDVDTQSIKGDEPRHDEVQGISGQADLQALTRAWLNERGSGELLSYPPHNLIERTTERITSQIALIELMTGNTNPKTNFALIIIQSEVERWKYLVRAYVRARLHKIATHTLHYLAPERRARLSLTEVAYATRLQELRQRHYEASFMAAFPERLRGLNDTAGGISMVDGIDEDGAVLVRGLGRRNRAARVGASEADMEEDSDSVVILGRGRDADEETSVKRGDIVVARWSDVREFVTRGELELV